MCRFCFNPTRVFVVHHARHRHVVFVVLIMRILIIRVLPPPCPTCRQSLPLLSPFLLLPVTILIPPSAMCFLTPIVETNSSTSAPHPPLFNIIAVTPTPCRPPHFTLLPLSVRPSYPPPPPPHHHHRHHLAAPPRAPAHRAVIMTSRRHEMIWKQQWRE